MPRGKAADELMAKEIMIAYIHSLGPSASFLFRQPGREATNEKNFSETWHIIVKAISGQAPATGTH